MPVGNTHVTVRLQDHDLQVCLPPIHHPIGFGGVKPRQPTGHRYFTAKRTMCCITIVSPIVWGRVRVGRGRSVCPLGAIGSRPPGRASACKTKLGTPGPKFWTEFKLCGWSKRLGGGPNATTDRKCTRTPPHSHLLSHRDEHEDISAH